MSHSPARFAVETLSRDEIAQRIAQLQQVGATGQIELMRAVAAGTICLALPGRQHRISLEELAQTSRPLLMLIGDDDGAATGPAGWECAWLACRWARSAVIHGAAAQAAHYREAIEAATLTGRTLLI